MSNHIWIQGHDVIPFRAWGRKEFPNSRDGMVIVDIDVAIRRYGQRYSLDDEGDLMIIETKEKFLDGSMGKVKGGMRRILKFIQGAFKTSEYSDRWRGVHLLEINYTEEIPICEKCEQPIMTEDEAYNIFLSAKLSYDKKLITHRELKILLEHAL